MGIRTIVGKADGHRDVAVLFDSTTETAFGPVFDSEDSVEAFLFFATMEAGCIDVRRLSQVQLAALYTRWMAGESRP